MSLPSTSCRSPAPIPTIELLNPAGDVLPYGDVSMTVYRDDAGNVTGLSYIASKAGEYRLTIRPDAGTTFKAELRLSKALSFATDTAMYYINLPLAVLLMFLARNIIRTRHRARLHLHPR